MDIPLYSHPSSTHTLAERWRHWNPIIKVKRQRTIRKYVTQVLHSNSPNIPTAGGTTKNSVENQHMSTAQFSANLWSQRSRQQYHHPDKTVIFVLYYFTTVLSHWDFSCGKFGLLFPGKASCDRVTLPQPAVHAGCFSVSIIHRTLTWTTGSLKCAQMLIHTVAHVVYTHRKRVCTESWLWERNPLPQGKSNLSQRRAGPTLYQLSYIPTHSIWVSFWIKFWAEANKTLSVSQSRRSMNPELHRPIQANDHSKPPSNVDRSFAPWTPDWKRIDKSSLTRHLISQTTTNIDDSVSLQREANLPDRTGLKTVSTPQTYVWRGGQTGVVGLEVMTTQFSPSPPSAQIYR